MTDKKLPISQISNQKQEVEEKEQKKTAAAAATKINYENLSIRT